LLFPITLRLPEGFNGDVEKLKDIPLFERGGRIFKLGELLELKVEPGLFIIRRENNVRYALVMANVEGRDIGSLIQELREKIEKEIQLPEGYFITFGGQFESQERAMKKLYIAVPLAIFFIFILLYLNFNSVKDALIVMLNVPFAVIGGVIALYISGFNLSVPSAIGFIAIFGIATLNGVVLVSYIKLMLQENLELRQAIKTAAKLRLRPILITAITTFIGLVPLLVITDIGSEVQKPLATVVVGGIITSTFLTLLVIPTVYELVQRRFSS
ncbi:efflux RND transporter permease subunit, partial [Aquifex sp.]